VSGRLGNVEVLEVLCTSADTTGVRAPREAPHNINVRDTDADLLQHVLEILVVDRHCSVSWLVAPGMPVVEVLGKVAKNFVHTLRRVPGQGRSSFCAHDTASEVQRIKAFNTLLK
jgi:hypothetical protein